MVHSCMVRGKSFDEVFGITEVGEDIFGKTFRKLSENFRKNFQKTFEKRDQYLTKKVSVECKKRSCLKKK